ncbi:MAG: sulfatase family protein, partial [Planctomycetota bacterium]
QTPVGIRNYDYAANFEAFFKNKEKSKPFCFWYGSFEPHRAYKKGIGVESGKRIEDVEVPGFLPDRPEIRSDILDYYFEIEHFDKHLGRMINTLEGAGELDNTIIVVTSDNGMPFPYAKTNLYDWGVRMPLAVRWGSKAKGGRVVDDFVSLADFAPTFLDCAGLKIPKEMTRKSIKNILLSNKSGRVDNSRDRVCTGIERHTWCRPNGVGYPIRAIRTYEWLYIRNYEPDRWPSGGPDFKPPYNKQIMYWQVDESPTKTYLLEHQNEPDIKPFFKKIFKKRPAEELYDVKNDPAQINNLADKPAFSKIKKQLREQLEQYQRQTNDPRVRGESPWDDYPFYYKDYWKLSPLVKDKSKVN